MVHVSMLELIRTGHFGPFRHGMTHAALKELLGEPPLWGPRDPVFDAKIWRYGEIEFHFDLDELFFIFSDHDSLTDGGATLVIKPWEVRGGMPRKEFEAALSEKRVPYSVNQDRFEPSYTHLTTGSGIKFTFAEDQETQHDLVAPSGLVAWSTLDLAYGDP